MENLSVQKRSFGPFTAKQYNDVLKWFVTTHNAALLSQIYFDQVTFILIAVQNGYLLYACQQEETKNKNEWLWKTALLNAQRYGLEAPEQRNALKRVHLLSKLFNQQSKVCQWEATDCRLEEPDWPHIGTLRRFRVAQLFKKLLLFQFASHTHWALKPNHRGGGEPRGLGVCHSVLLHKKKVKDAVWAIGSNWQRIGHGQPSEWKSTWECSIWTSKGHKRPTADNEATQRSLAAVE